MRRRTHGVRRLRRYPSMDYTKIKNVKKGIFLIKYVNKIKQTAGSSGTPIAVVCIVYDYFIFQWYNSILIIFVIFNLFLENYRETIDFKGNLPGE